ncbi:hypothetical protein [Bacillus suaedae]|uniref:Uncharacterized protein n=1 Tax=Halalkalibacter suaedae TaxID=2822140 RepID=A0A940WWH9_9BACI|nr:hypothetical protein [Bacillus suaedae]MBP3953626.1 hypothetical protein [Bacillus suaedae]
MNDKPVTARSLAYELDFEMGAIRNLVSLIADVELEFIHLVETMEEVEDRGQEELYYREHSRKARVLAKLMQYTVDELKCEVEKTSHIRDTIFETFVKNEG